MSKIPVIDLENTIMGDIKRKIEPQISIPVEQNKLLTDNYNKMYDSQQDKIKFL